MKKRSNGSAVQNVFLIKYRSSSCCIDAATKIRNITKHELTEVKIMSSQNRSNRVEVPEAKAAMDRFKTEVASELGVNLKEGYNGDLTSREAGSIGGEMVRRMIKSYEESIK